MTYKQIRTVAFQFADIIKSLPHQFFTLNFPERWKDVLQELQNEGRNRDKTKFINLPIATLNKSLRALAPDLISIARYADSRGDRTWLYSSQPIDTEKLHLVVLAWVQHTFPKASESSRQRVIKDLQASELKWQTKTINLAQYTQEVNGMAKLPSESFAVLPDFLAAHLSQHVLEFGPESLTFIRAPLAPGVSGVELVSWPPLRVEGKKEEAYYSVVLTIKVQTIPFQSFPVIYCSFSLRRWVSHPNTRIPGGRETSVYLLTNVSWLTGQLAPSFQVAPIRWSRSDEKQFQLTWGSYLAPILNDLQQPFKSFPTPEAMRQDPIKALSIGNRPHAGIVYRDGMNWQHIVGKGLAPGDRRPLAEQLEQLFAPMLTFTAPLPRVTYTFTRPSNPFFQSTGNIETQIIAARRLLLNQGVGGSFNIEIRYQSSDVKEALIEAIVETLGTPSTDTDVDLNLNINCELLGKVGDRLNVDTTIRYEQERIQQAIQQRVDEVMVGTPKTPTTVTATFIELEGKDFYDDNNEADPKHALRLGFAHTHRLTQFITPRSNTKDESDNLNYRAHRSLLDMLRQFGVHLEAPQIPGLPKSINSVGLWLTKQYRKSSPTRTQEMLPVLVYINPERQEVLATASGLEDWLPYPQALLAIAQGKAKGFHQARQAMPFIRETLEGEILPQGDTLLLCHAQNLRSAWPWLANVRLSQDSLSFGKEKPMSITEWPGLRIVRIRSSQDQETPEWFAEHEAYGDDVGFAKGLFQMGERVFASTYNKPKQFPFSPSLSKVARWKGPKMQEPKDPSPTKYVWNPGLYELTVACLQPEDEEAWPWAAITHELRNISLHHDDATALPLPLHLARGMEEYILRLS